jgi:hypothetical protein
VTTDTTNKVITAIQPWPSESINGLVTALGDSGQSSGGTLVTTIAPMASTLNVVQATITYATNTVTNTTYTTNYPTNDVVTTNSYSTYEPRSTNVPVYTTNVSSATNFVWTNSPVTNKVYVTYNNPFTNAAKTLGDNVVKYKFAAKAGKFYEATLVTPQRSTVTNTGTVAKPKLVTNIITATFSVNEYYNDVLATNWVKVPTVTTTTNVVQTGTAQQTVYVQKTKFYTVTNPVVSQDPVITSSTQEVLVPVAIATNTSTNAWTNSGPNYVLTYDSLVNITSSANVNGNSNQPILLSYNGVGGNGVVASTNNPSVAGITSQVANGTYTLWNFDHLFLNAAGVANSSATLVRDSIKSTLSTSVTFPNLKLSDLNVISAGDGATPFPKGL